MLQEPRRMKQLFLVESINLKKEIVAGEIVFEMLAALLSPRNGSQ